MKSVLVALRKLVKFVDFILITTLSTTCTVCEKLFTEMLSSKPTPQQLTSPHHKSLTVRLTINLQITLFLAAYHSTHCSSCSLHFFTQQPDSLLGGAHSRLAGVTPL